MIKGVLNYSRYQNALNNSQLNESRAFSRATSKTGDLYNILGSSVRSLSRKTNIQFGTDNVSFKMKSNQ